MDRLGGFASFTHEYYGMNKGMRVSLGGWSTPTALVWGQGGFVPEGADLLAGSVAFRNPIDLAGGARTIRTVSGGSTTSPPPQV